MNLSLFDVLLSFSGLCLLLLVGTALRQRLVWLRRLGIPEALIAGLLGLLIGPFGPWSVFPEQVYRIWSQAPGVLISLVFATLFLGQRLPSPGVIWNRAAGQTAFGMVLGFGQYLVGGLLVLLVLQPLFGTSPLMAALIEVGFEGGDAVSIDGERLSPAALLERLNNLGGDNGIGRLDLVENRFVGMKSRGVYETPGGTVLLTARRGLESLTLDRGAAHLKDELMPRYAELIYNGLWFSPEREMLQAAIDESQKYVTGSVTLKLYKGTASVVARKSNYSLYSEAHVTFEEDAVYDQKDAEGFINLNALRLKLLGRRKH